ncbi:hypothetical protein F909_04033 [Acinetobacter sp. ANC 3929]|uniref:Uncharacterized protein n=1 Tax=Acinetobacter dispersus TaxID=70348 RepID=N9LLU5_9GAMM|nr:MULTISPECIES: hypothetical protein [Acinetobacter]ENW78344.1 hypothetical protein F909_04033 [Acinetobacter sp. ANC 3929]ENW97242.1 hypothetical protein F904_00077 [Acinetobacter dispersus]MCH7353872.1 hypothetical protein [Acinetobacter sp. NIPH 2023]MCH7355485.1 hypothetical protein [Acinetobacter sp. NIPH 1958]MCH7361199.1 hypothetical protein [Acinetobacter sp. NIPH 2024]
MPDFLPSKKELTNALAWFTAPVNDAIKKGKETAADIAEWLWVVLQGDFAEDQTTAQIVTGTVISMIPFVDQICDVRDICANATKIKEDSNNPWAWIGLILTLIGLFPVLGSLFKGVFKVILAPIRRFMLKPATKGLKFTGGNIYKFAEPAIESGITELNKFLARPAVKKAIKNAKITNIYKATASKIREVKGMLTKQALLGVFDKLVGYLRDTVKFIDKYASKAIGAKARQMLQTVIDVRNLANQKLGEFLKPVQDFLERLAVRIEKESDQAFKATTNVKNIHNFKKVGTDAELKSVLNNKPNWVDVAAKEKYEALIRSPIIPEGFPNIGTKDMPLKNAYNTFHRAKPVTIPEGEVLYRVLDPRSLDNSICWMREAEYKKLKSKADWRRYFAVFASWNHNGEVVKYKVPKGGINVWEGPAASQTFKNSAGKVEKVNSKGEVFVLEGGGIQIVLDPKDLVHANISKREATPWGYDSGLIGEAKTSMVGVPRLEQNWYGDKK